MGESAPALLGTGGVCRTGGAALGESFPQAALTSMQMNIQRLSWGVSLSNVALLITVINAKDQGRVLTSQRSHDPHIWKSS